MIKKILFVVLIIMLVIQFTFADGFNTSQDPNPESTEDTTISELIHYLLSLKLGCKEEESNNVPIIEDDTIHRRGHRIRRKVDDDKKQIDGNHK